MPHSLTRVYLLLFFSAILSKFDLIESEYVHLEFLENYPRSAIGAICRTPLVPS
jgi:hypothetical protein